MMHTRILMQPQAFSYNNGFEIAITSYDDVSQRETCVQTLTAKSVQEGEHLTSCLKMTREELQSLMDTMWQYGFRPTDAGSVDGELSATKKHLDDMRRLVFQSEPVQLVGVAKAP